MKTTIAIVCVLTMLTSLSIQAQTTEITADYGPPAQANVWEKFTIPINAESFNVTEEEMQSVLSSVTSFWIRTEMHTGNDVGGIDNVLIGTAYSSYFEGSSEGWSSGGDGTMAWVPEGGHEGGFLQISDWATGDWHWLIAPVSWSGDWTNLIGQNIEFWFKTNQPSYAAIIKITSGVINRLVINTIVSSTILPDDSVNMQLEVIPVPEQDLTVTFTTSNNNCIRVPASIVVPAGNSTVNLYFKSAPGAEVGCNSVIEASSSGYLTSRVTIMVLDNYGTDDIKLYEAISIYPNPCQGSFILSNSSGKEIRQLMIHDMDGRRVLHITEPLSEIEIINLINQPPGLYFLKLLSDVEEVNMKLLVR